MTWQRPHWRVLTAVGALFVVGVASGSACSGDSGETMTVVRTTTMADTAGGTVSETVTETIDPTAEQVAALKDREAALYALAREVRQRREAALDALLRKFRQWKKALDERAAALRRQERVLFGDG